MSEPVGTGGSMSALSPASVGGRRRSHKKLRLVKKKTVRSMLAKKGLRMRGGGTDAAAESVAPATGGRRRKSRGRTHRRGKSLFGMRF